MRKLEMFRVGNVQGVSCDQLPMPGIAMGPKF